MRMGHWILKDKKPVEVDLMTWAKWFDNLENRRVDYTELKRGYVSTVFLGIDHNFFGGKPLLFESMSFDTGTGFDGEPIRYHTYEEAEAGHKDLVEQIKTNNK